MPAKLAVFNISKSFGPVQANQNLSLTFEKGNIHAILGENGAGKSTLMNILYGLVRPDSGEIHLDGKPIEITNPRIAIQHGIGMVHQHFMLAGELSVLENVITGLEPTRFGFITDRAAAREKILNISDQFGLEVDPDAIIKDLPVGVQQRVEILKLLYRSADILIMDEPTAVLTPQETTNLFKVLKSLASRGHTIIFITHKLKEVMEIADDISVLRNGELVATRTPSQVDENKLAALMVGRGVSLTAQKSPAKADSVMLSVRNLEILDDLLNLVVDGVSFDVHCGEILGIAGVQGNGQTELVESVTGLRPPLLGQVFIDGIETTNLPRRRIIERGVGHIPEDRQRDGLILSSPISTNLVLCSYYKPPFTKGLELQEQAILEYSQKRAGDFDVRTPDVRNSVESLSGGNQQKVIIAREFSRDLKLLVASQPTRGLDVGSIEYVHKQIINKRDDGAAVLLVSTELDEIMSMSDRIAVIFRGKIVAIIDAQHALREQIGLLMAGVIPENLDQKYIVNEAI
jgi:simple sugar transport system ATP-binding protein